MRLKCLHGYFIMDEDKTGDMSGLIRLYDFDIVQKDNYFTFASLKDAPRYSISGGEYLGASATATYEGEPWEVMRANGLVYDFVNDEIVPLLSISQRVSITPAANYFLSTGLILPGSLTDEGLRVKDYSARFSFDTMRFKYSAVSYE